MSPYPLPPENRLTQKNNSLDTTLNSNHKHIGDGNMNLIINRLSELSDALNELSLQSEAELVRNHIMLLSSKKYDQIIENEGVEAVLSDFVNDF